MNKDRKPQYISQCLQLAILLEVSIQKPGNIGFLSSFEGTQVEHFLASAVASGMTFQEAAYRGISVAKNRLKVSDVKAGELIKACALDVSSWQKGGNTILGTVMLFVPIAVAAGITPVDKRGSFDLSILRKNIDSVVKATSACDSVNLYEAVDVACPSGLGDAPDFDLKDPESKNRLLKDNVSLFDVFKIASSYDDICYEWVNNYKITFDLSYPYLIEQLNSKPLNISVLNTFLRILAEHPDTFIARKMGKEAALRVSSEAKAVLELGGLETERGRQALSEFDSKLRASGNKYNPGTTADLTAAALALCTLSGYRP